MDIDYLRELGENWDGHGAGPVPEAAIRTVEALRVVPLSSGGLQVELHAGGGDLEVEVAADGRVRSVFWERSEV
jgi:hypothetical protein